MFVSRLKLGKKLKLLDVDSVLSRLLSPAGRMISEPGFSLGRSSDFVRLKEKGRFKPQEGGRNFSSEVVKLIPKPLETTPNPLFSVRLLNSASLRENVIPRLKRSANLVEMLPE